jgi:hypothetical protein
MGVSTVRKRGGQGAADWWLAWDRVCDREQHTQGVQARAWCVSVNPPGGTRDAGREHEKKARSGAGSFVPARLSSLSLFSPQGDLPGGQHIRSAV